MEDASRPFQCCLQKESRSVMRVLGHPPGLVSVLTLLLSQYTNSVLEGPNSDCSINTKNRENFTNPLKQSSMKITAQTGPYPKPRGNGKGTIASYEGVLCSTQRRLCNVGYTDFTSSFMIVLFIHYLLPELISPLVFTVFGCGCLIQWS